MVKYFGVVCWNESVCPTTNFTKVRERRESGVPELVRSLTIVTGGTSDVGQICGSATEFVPHVGWGATGKTHGACLIHKSTVKLFCLPVLGRSVRSGKEVKDTVFRTEVGHLCRGEFTIVSDKALQFVGSMEFNGSEPMFEGSKGIAFRAKGKGPNKGREVINYIHGIEATSI